MEILNRFLSNPVDLCVYECSQREMRQIVIDTLGAWNGTLIEPEYTQARAFVMMTLLLCLCLCRVRLCLCLSASVCLSVMSVCDVCLSVMSVCL